MKYVRLESIICPQSGELGLKFKETPITRGFFAATTGLTLAHDLYEHQNGLSKIGGFTDEYEAFGAILSGRAAYGALNGGYESLWTDVLNVFGYQECGLGYPQEQLSSQWDSQIKFILDIVEDGLDHQDSHHGLDEEQYAMAWAQSRMQIHNSMTLGAQKFQRRFRDCICFLSLFDESVKTFDEILLNTDFEGQEFIFGYDFHANTRWREVHEYRL